MELNEDAIDALSEIVNIGVGRAACSLSELIGTRIDLRVPVVKIVDVSVAEQGSEAGMSIMQSFDGEVAGNALLIFPEVSGKNLAGLLGGYEDTAAIPELEVCGILSEVGNIVLNAVLGSLANTIETNLTYTVPEFFVQERVSVLVEGRQAADDHTDCVLHADAQFSVESQDIRGSIVIAFHLGSFDSLVNHLQRLVG